MFVRVSYKNYTGLDWTKSSVPINEFLPGVKPAEAAAASRAVLHKPHTHRHVAAQDTQGGTERAREREEGDCPIDLVTALARPPARPPAPLRARGRAFERAAAAAASSSSAVTIPAATKDPLPGHVDPSEQSFAHMEELREGGRTKHNYFRRYEMYGGAAIPSPALQRT